MGYFVCKGWCQRLVDDSWFYKGRGRRATGINIHEQGHKCQQCKVYYHKEKYQGLLFCICCGQRLRYKSRSRFQRANKKAMSKEPDPWMKRPEPEPFPMPSGEEEEEE